MTLIVLTLLLFEPIIIDEQMYNSIISSAHQNFRGPEYEILMQMMQNLEQRAVATKPKDDAEHK